MIAAFFFALILIAVGVACFIGVAKIVLKIVFEKPPAIPHAESFKAVAMKRGQLEVSVSYQAPAPVSFERIVRRWATRLDMTGQPTEPVYDALEAELIRHFPDLDPQVVSIIAIGTESLIEKPKKLTLAESVVSRFQAKNGAAEALAEVAGISAEEIKLKETQKEFAKSEITHIYYDDNRA